MRTTYLVTSARDHCVQRLDPLSVCEFDTIFSESRYRSSVWLDCSRANTLE